MPDVVSGALPGWADPKNRSVFDAPGQGLLRSVVAMLGLDDPTQIMALGVPVETGAATGGALDAFKRLSPEALDAVAQRFPRLASALKMFHGTPDVVPEDVAYRGTHTAPGRSSGAPLHDLQAIYPDDVYGPNGPQYYGTREPRDASTFRIVREMRGKPDADVTVYRAVPKGVAGYIAPGDWVTVNKSYAQEHGDRWLRGDYTIVEKRVKARDIFTEGNGIHEWGYDPQPEIK